MLDQKKFYINGEWVSPKKPNDLKVTDPSTEEECAVISIGGVEDVNDAVNAATKAFETWACLLYTSDAADDMQWCRSRWSPYH